MKERINKILSYIFHLPFGIVLAFLLIAACGYYAIKGIYTDLRYHFSDVLFNAGFWVFGILLVLGLVALAKCASKNKNSN